MEIARQYLKDSSQSTLALSAVVAVVLSATSYLYWSTVPSDKGNLGSLKDVPYTKEMERHFKTSQRPFREDAWPEHGYVNLGNGETHWYMLGPVDGERLVFVHGMGSPAPTLKPFLDKIASKGYRILCYDLYGRGYSSSPADRYDETIFIAQLAGLLHKLAWGKTAILGYSLGGAITTAYVARFPELITKVIYIAPAGIMTIVNPLVYILKIPILGSLFLHNSRKLLINLSTQYHAVNESDNRDVRLYNDVQRYHIAINPGLPRAFGQTAINFPWGGLATDFMKVENSHSGKVFCLWGSLDVVVHTNLSVHLKELMPSLVLRIEENLSHSIPIENSTLASSIIVGFLKA